MNSQVPQTEESNIYGSIISTQLIKVIAESTGINSLADDIAKELADDVSGKIKSIVQDALKFMHHSKREILLTSDIDSALKVRDLEPQYGFQSKDCIPFRFATGGGRELHIAEDKEITLKDAISQITAKLPLSVTLRSHWLAVDGEQPAIPENPPSITRKEQAIEAINPVLKLDLSVPKPIRNQNLIGRIPKLRNEETVLVKQLAIHELSVEQQLYYKAITEACVGADESRRNQALHSLTADPGLYEMLPRLCTFISEGVKVNVVQNNLAMLIYLMRMVKAVLNNTTLYLEKYLHEIIPAVTTCIVSKQLCLRPELDNHWALRDFASRLMAHICKAYNTSTNNLQTRITRIFVKALENDKRYLSSMYGAIVGFAELGVEVVKIFVLTRLRYISDRIEGQFLGVQQKDVDKKAAENIRTLVQKHCIPILTQMRSPPDFVEEYRNDFGNFLGPCLCLGVLKARGGSCVTSHTLQLPSTVNIEYNSVPQFSGMSLNRLPNVTPCLSFNNTLLRTETPLQATQNPPELVHYYLREEIIETTAKNYKKEEK